MTQNQVSFNSNFFRFVEFSSQVLKALFISLYCRVYILIHTSYIAQVFCSIYYGIISVFMGDRQKLEWKTHWQSPVCRHILRRKYFLSRSQNSLFSVGCCSILAVFLVTEMKNGFFSNAIGANTFILWYVEFFLLLILCANCFLAITWYLKSAFCKPMPVSPVQQKLFGICPNDPGFKVKEKNESVSEVVKPKRLQLSSWRDSFEGGSPTFMSVTQINTSYNSWLSSPSKSNESNSLPSFMSCAPINNSYNSWHSSPEGSHSFDTTSSSWNFCRPSSPPNFTSTPKTKNNERSVLRRLNQSDNIESPFERPIKTRKHLEEFLKVQEEEKKKSISFEEAKPFVSKLTTVDNSPMSVLGKCRYQRAYRLPHLEMAEDDSSEIHCGDNVLNKLKITDKMLMLWCERTRKWMCQTILVKLVHEIDEINSTLMDIGLPEFQIGNVSLFALHQIVATKAQHLPTLTAVLPYINMHSNQEYLVKRLRDLAQGGCMGDFKWNSGGSYDDKPWCEDLPPDSSLVMYLLCCYMDAHLPPDPHFPEGKPFSSKYFKKVPEKVVLSKDSVYIYQSCLNPPHFKVVVGEDLCSLTKGRNNMFYALAVFLHYLKIKECGMLGRVNLGPSGLNMMWIVD